MVGLCSYVSGVCALALTLTLFISYVPGTELFALALQAACGCGMLVAGATGIAIARLPAGHCVHRCKALWAALVALALTGTYLMGSIL